MSSTDTELLQRLHEGKMILAPTKGFSMRPFIEGGIDRVLVRRHEEINIGDIVMVPYNGIVILHRVYGIDGDRLTLMGDGNLRGNEMVNKADVWGTVVEIVKPDGRYTKPHKALLWRHLLPIRKYLLKIHRKWNKLRSS